MDNLKRYIDLRDSLAREKAQLEQRLEQINNALGDRGGSAPATGGSQPQTGGAERNGAGRGGRRGPRNTGGLSLREAVLRVVGRTPKSKEEILNGVKSLGYKFTTSNPLNSLGVILYGKNPKFKNENGRFSLADGAAGGGSPAQSKAQPASGGAGAFKRKKRQMSPEARERIAAAQRARWAKAKAGGK